MVIVIFPKIQMKKEMQAIQMKYMNHWNLYVETLGLSNEVEYLYNKVITDKERQRLHWNMKTVNNILE